jgi:hypothetical protein
MDIGIDCQHAIEGFVGPFVEEGEGVFGHISSIDIALLTAICSSFIASRLFNPF